MSNRGFGLKILQWNIRSVNSNSSNLFTIVGEELPDIVFLNETWLKKDSNFTVNF